jgi:RNA polymerase sigma factor (sigma-70 family)
MTNRANEASSQLAFWEEAYTEHFGSLCTRASKALTRGNSAEAEDAVSEAFLRVMRYAPDPGTIENVVSYLWTIIRRVWIAQQIRPAAAQTDRLEDFRRTEIERLASVRVEPEVLAVLNRQDFLLELKMKLGPMSLEEKALMELFLEGNSLNEIAEILGEDVKRVRFRWYRFIARQRYRLRKEERRAMAVGE